MSFYQVNERGYPECSGSCQKQKIIYNPLSSKYLPFKFKFKFYFRIVQTSVLRYKFQINIRRSINTKCCPKNQM